MFDWPKSQAFLSATEAKEGRTFDKIITSRTNQEKVDVNQMQELSRCTISYGKCTVGRLILLSKALVAFDKIIRKRSEEDEVDIKQMQDLSSKTPWKLENNVSSTALVDYAPIVFAGHFLTDYKSDDPRRQWTHALYPDGEFKTMWSKANAFQGETKSNQ